MLYDQGVDPVFARRIMYNFLVCTEIWTSILNPKFTRIALGWKTLVWNLVEWLESLKISRKMNIAIFNFQYGTKPYNKLPVICRKYVQYKKNQKYILCAWRVPFNSIMCPDPSHSNFSVHVWRVVPTFLGMSLHIFLMRQRNSTICPWILAWAESQLEIIIKYSAIEVLIMQLCDAPTTYDYE